MLYYIGYYSCDSIAEEKRSANPAAANKMGYLIHALGEALNEPFTVVSPAGTKEHRFFRGSCAKLPGGVFLRTFPTFSSKHRLLRGGGHLLTRLSFLLYLLLKVRREEHLLVYHSLAYQNVIRWICKLKKCRLTIEVEEIYSDVTGNTRQRESEINYLQTADSYLYITELLRNEVDAQKASVLYHGTYRALPDYGMRFDDDRIHVVYAGTFRKAKGGVYTAIAAAEYLDHRYTLEILGGGSEEENAAVQELIREVSEKTKCKIKYVGYKSGKDFDSYIQACHIGLSTQQAVSKFNATSFPSKVLMYMSNGLRVVSVRIPAVETSAVGDRVYYYDKQDPKEIARVIRSVTLDDGYDSRAHLNVLHRNFVEQLKRLLNG